MPYYGLIRPISLYSWGIQGIKGMDKSGQIGTSLAILSGPFSGPFFMDYKRT
tara:strand:+ start:2049 stop:2204 length:156 start_codon:yes stop_codon:yes gene_type:complete